MSHVLTFTAKQTQVALTIEAAPGALDTARVVGELRFILDASQFYLLESKAEALAAWLLAPPSADVTRPRIEAVSIKLTDANMASAEVQRKFGHYAITVEDKAFGFVDVIYETKECGVYRERVAPGKTLPAHAHHLLDESELVLGDGLLLQGRAVAAGLAHSWPRGFVHRYDNPTGIEQSFLCIDRPKFIPSDEVELDIPVAELVPVEATRYF